MAAGPIHEDDRPAALVHEVRDPAEFLGLEQRFGNLAKDDELVGVEHRLVGREMPLLVAADETRLAPHAGDGGVHLPFLVALIEIPEVARLPARAAVDEQHLALLGDGAEAEPALVVREFAFTVQRRDADLEFDRHAERLDARGQGFEACCGEFLDREFEGHGQGGFGLGGELFFPHDLVAVLDGEGDGLVGRGLFLEQDLAAHHILMIDALGHHRAQDGQIARRHLAAGAQREDRQILARQHLR